MVTSPDSSSSGLTVSVDVLAGEDDAVQFDEGLGIDTGASVTPVNREVSARLAGNPTGDLVSGDRHIVLGQQFAVALDPGLRNVSNKNKRDFEGRKSGSTVKFSVIQHISSVVESGVCLERWNR